MHSMLSTLHGSHGDGRPLHCMDVSRGHGPVILGGYALIFLRLHAKQAVVARRLTSSTVILPAEGV